MEGFELLSTGVWSILPPLLALGLALITKEVYSSLLVGVFSGPVSYTHLDVYKRQACRLCASTT